MITALIILGGLSGLSTTFLIAAVMAVKPHIPRGQLDQASEIERPGNQTRAAEANLVGAPTA